ncbi:MULTISPECIES: helix-turn-helix domain-containing protein [Bacteroidales]|jgi:excisionase family DNA binding protein|uniref:helix-turn-helix domain-containing protein n=1 Tax=Bacteroidales TaxID=171549 RepID=UPI000ECD094E|nr:MULTISPECIES: helix-turn-helix domain-containing protein [Bacteroidales]MCS2635867.1 helix-turn-helix domain-containing protein [Bacteroides ovatus]MCS2635868.1 helix-turn-helix domain-containing protein [Bacteroides ovatus]RGO44584.1 helix-turn-helix domain-containing protein [Parabacteroides distasonis]
MKATKKCQFCGKPFVTRSGMQRYCSEACQAEAKRARTAQKNNLFKVARPLMEIQHQEYLTFSKAATLMGCSRQYVYKLVALGKLKASRISSRMAFIRRADIERMLEGNPYHRVLPGSTSAQGKSAPSSLPAKKEKREKETDEVLDFYSGEEVMSLFKVKQSWLYTTAKRNRIPICRIAGKNYYSKKHINDFFGVSVDISRITDWLLTEEAEELFGMKPSALRAYVYRHKIPTKREYGRTYYSKSHLDELRRTDLVNDERYYTVEQVQQIYGLSSANICHIVKVKHIEKIKVGVKNLLLRSDVERVMAERNKQP